VIEFRDVHKHFGPLHVLNGIDLSVAEREVVVIIGPSGSGKSTLIRTINGLEAIESGTLVVNGIAVHAEHVDVNRLRKDVGMVFQSFNLFPHLTAIENVMLAPLKVRKLGRSEARDRAMRLLEKVGIPEKADVPPVRLSGGQQQRVAIARALAMEPRIMLFDEPTSALDAETEGQLLEAIDTLMEGRTTLIIAHRLSTIRGADTIVVLDEGRVVESGSHAELLHREGRYAHLHGLQFGVPA